jgi:quercetin dioxygenase-like cupin family protein
MAQTESHSAFDTWNGREPYRLFPQVRLHSIGGDQVLLCRVSYEPSTHVERHAHEFTEQVMVVLEGDVTMDVEGEKRRMEAGDVAVVNRGQQHELWSESGCVFVEALAPVALDHVGDAERDLRTGVDRGSGHVER